MPLPAGITQGITHFDHRNRGSDHRHVTLALCPAGDPRFEPRRYQIQRHPQGCEDDQALWGDAMSPTQMQRADMGLGPNPPIMATTGGDSEDPFVDNASYPFVAGPWWSNPAYNGG